MPPPAPQRGALLRPAAANSSSVRVGVEGRSDCNGDCDRAMHGGGDGAPSTPRNAERSAGAGAWMPFSPIAQPVFSPRAGGGDDVRIPDAGKPWRGVSQQQAFKIVDKYCVAARASVAVSLSLGLHRRRCCTGGCGNVSVFGQLQRCGKMTVGDDGDSSSSG